MMKTPSTTKAHSAQKTQLTVCSEEPILQPLQEALDASQKLLFIHQQMSMISTKLPPKPQQTVPRKKKLTFEEQIALKSPPPPKHKMDRGTSPIPTLTPPLLLAPLSLPPPHARPPSYMHQKGHTTHLKGSAALSTLPIPITMNLGMACKMTITIPRVIQTRICAQLSIATQPPHNDTTTYHKVMQRVATYHKDNMHVAQEDDGFLVETLSKIKRTLQLLPMLKSTSDFL